MIQNLEGKGFALLKTKAIMAPLQDAVVTERALAQGPAQGLVHDLVLAHDHPRGVQGLTLGLEVALHQGHQPMQQSVHEHLQDLLSQQGLHHLRKDTMKDTMKDMMKDVMKVTIDCQHWLKLMLASFQPVFVLSTLSENCALNLFFFKEIPVVTTVACL